ncbi:hypothetical protein NEOC65_001988 [Neochlamydia sp. AcF65]|nr:hypothetical protein [Neochlamydia sp. AcF65]MBS4170592.1 hypothetical protein [Neochlamydia sp. AcF95]
MKILLTVWHFPHVILIPSAFAFLPLIPTFVFAPAFNKFIVRLLKQIKLHG